MATCSKCNGTGEQTYDEDGRRVTDACYHCGTTGEVDEELDWHDRLQAVAVTLAERMEREYREACDADPQGDGYDLYAAENGMTTWDYFQSQVWDRAYRIQNQIADMDRPSQELLVGWNEAA